MTDDDQHSRFETLGDNRDLDGLARLRDDVAPPTAAVLAAARARLQEQDVRPAVLALHRHRRTSPVRRRVLVGLGAAAAVAAIAAGSFALTEDGATPGRQPQAGPSAPGATSGPATIRFVNASQLLDAASATAVKSPAPAAGQYLHVRSHSLDVTTIDVPPNEGAYELTENRNDTWTSPGGTSYYRTVANISVDYPTAKQRAYAASAPGGVPTRTLTWSSVAADGTFSQLYPNKGTLPNDPDGDEPAATVWEEPGSVDLATVPRDPAALRASLYRFATERRGEVVQAGKGDQATTDDLAYSGLTAAITSAQVSGDLRAALYQVAKTIPGVRLIGSLANYDGVKGVAVGRVDTFHVEHDLIFTADGSTYLGDRTIARAPSEVYDVPAGTVLGASAVSVDVTGKPDLPR